MNGEVESNCQAARRVLFNIQGHEFNASAARTLVSSSPPCSSSSCAGVEAGVAESGTRPGLAAWPSG